MVGLVGDLGDVAPVALREDPLAGLTAHPLTELRVVEIASDLPGEVLRLPFSKTRPRSSGLTISVSAATELEMHALPMAIDSKGLIGLISSHTGSGRRGKGVIWKIDR